MANVLTIGAGVALGLGIFSAGCGAFLSGAKSAGQERRAAATAAKPSQPPQPAVGVTGLAKPIEEYLRAASGRVPDASEVDPTRLYWMEGEGWKQGAVLTGNGEMRTVEFLIAHGKVSIVRSEAEKLGS